MRKSICKYNFRDVDKAFSEFDRNVRNVMERVGDEAVDYAVKNGNYRDVTGRLRASNKSRVEGRRLVIYNDAPYAADVEARGKVVISGAALYAERRLREEFSR